MNAYFLKMTKEEKENILDKHKNVYDGFVTQYVKPNEQPLYVQDFANDKNGVTLNNKGTVSGYKNVGINEDIMSGAEFEPEVNIETSVELEDDEFTGLDTIGDGEDDLEHGTFEEQENEDGYLDLVDDELLESLQEQVNKTKDMFKRFKNY